MHSIPSNLKKLLFGKSEEVPLSQEEQAIWDEWVIYNERTNNTSIDVEGPALQKAFELWNKWKDRKQARWEKFEKKVIKKDPKVLQIVKLRWHKRYKQLAAAAAVLVLVLGSTGIYFWLKKQEAPHITNHRIQPAKDNNIVPGTKNAVLTLSDGSTIVLSDMPPEKPVNEDGTQIVNIPGKQLVYYPADRNIPPSLVIRYNTITTPRGNEYKLTLSDGSQVWINAASSLHFPVRFTGNERIVQLNGEAYFEIKEEPAKPFGVVTSYARVLATGTKFNVKAYEKDSLVTATLVDGALEVGFKDKIEKLQPHEQIIIAPDSIQVKSRVDINKVIAWKNGHYILDGESIQSIMDYIARWYDVDVQVDQTLQINDLHGKINRKKDFNKLIEFLNDQLEGAARIEVKGRTVIVTKS